MSKKKRNKGNKPENTTPGVETTEVVAEEKVENVNPPAIEANPTGVAIVTEPVLPKIYLPKGSRVVLESTASQDTVKPPFWYTTKNIVDVEGSIDSIHPLTTLPVRMVVAQGYRIYYQESQLIVNDTSLWATIAKVKPWQLIYDIPAYRGIPNPSGFLRSRAFRANLSCWVIPENNIPYEWCDDMRERGVDIKLAPYDPKGGAELVTMAIASIHEDIRELIGDAERTRRNADRYLDAQAEKGVAGQELIGTENKYAESANLMLKRLIKKLDDIEKCAESFGIDSRLLRVMQARDIGESMFSGMAHRAKMFVEAQKAMRASNDRDMQSMANEMSNNPSLAVIAADMMDDNGLDGGKLRDAFINQE